MAITSPILAPIIALIAWSLVMWIWMYATRLPAVRKSGMALDPNALRGEQMNQLPATVRWKSDNYTHLMEQPTLFYALALCLALMGEGDGANLVLAWVYVGLRLVHSLVQALTNKIEVRFIVFVGATLALFGMTVNAIVALA